MSKTESYNHPTNSKASRPGRWGRIRDLPVSKSTAEKLIREKLINSFAPILPGRKRAIRFVDLDSFDRWVRGSENTEKEQTTAK